MKDKQSKKLAKKIKKEAKKNNPNRKLKRNMIWASIVLLAFMSTGPIAALTQKSSFGSLTKIGAEVQKADGVTVKLAQAKMFRKANLVEIDLLVDVPANQVDYQLNPILYDVHKKKVKNVKIEKINANFYTIFVSKSDLSKFQYYVAVPEKGNTDDTIVVGNPNYGFIVSGKNTKENTVFKAHTSTYYISESRTLLSQKYQRQLVDIDNEKKENDKQVEELKAKNEQLLLNADGLTQDEKLQVADQIKSNNTTIESYKKSNVDLEKSKAPINEKIEALKNLKN
ncbi:hypothetical protein IL308_10880 [Lactococcus lactis]|uniref:hypothetical protein n=1 Tax=Lactococcus lactis TaxID=1358 RepID=UPI0019147242|nr:hypothetical protein [Lactococcus lactis]MBK5077257.1 hypothetical protein [Lactococcus lactis]WDA67419.1 hypothetical protein IL310_00715 [Lactococcus lactis]